MAAAAEWQPLREALQGWSALERAEQRRRLARVLERIDYDGRHGGTASVRWRAPLGGGEPSPIPMRTYAAAQTPSPPLPEVSRAGSGLPRITRLLASAVRFEGLLREGTVRDYAELARLGGVSRARMTQIMSLRNLAPVIQERILGLPVVEQADFVGHHQIRIAVAIKIPDSQVLRIGARRERQV